MTTWVALLRGINVGGQKKVAMADLRKLLESLGCEDVRTVLNSGNAVFSAPGQAPELERCIGAQIEKDLGLAVKVLLRSAKELDAVVAANPFIGRGDDPKELHVVFTSAAPVAKKLGTIDRDEIAPDEFELGKRVIYVRLPNGVMESKLPDWQRVTGLDVTMRTWKTVIRLRDLAVG